MIKGVGDGGSRPSGKEWRRQKECTLNRKNETSPQRPPRKIWRVVPSSECVVVTLNITNNKKKRNEQGKKVTQRPKRHRQRRFLGYCFMFVVIRRCILSAPAPSVLVLSSSYLVMPCPPPCCHGVDRVVSLSLDLAEFPSCRTSH